MYLGLDLGTSGIRALLVSPEGEARGVADADYPVAHPHPGWSEQNPADWIVALKSVLSRLKADHPREMTQVQGLALSGQMHGAVLLDQFGVVLHPCILWNDTRAHKEAAALDTDEVRRLSGNIVFPGFTAPKLAWIAHHAPETFSRVATVLLPKDYIVHWLTGQAATDMSDAAGTAWLDVDARGWSPDLLAAGGMRPDQMPRLHEGTDVVAPIRADRAADLGLPETCQIIAGGADNAAAACGVGALAEGQGFVSLGTSGVLLAARDTCAPAPDTAVHTFCHSVPGHWYQMGVTLAATDSLNWLARLTGQTPSALTHALGTELPAPAKSHFYPYLSGERTPHNDAAIRAGFTGLDIAHGPRDLTHAVMQGVAFSLRDSLEALTATGAELDRLLAIGGGTQSLLWTRMLATILDLPLDRPKEGAFGAALGAARLAICGVTGAAPDAIMSAPPIRDSIDPDTKHRNAYDDAYLHFRDGYAKLKALQ